MSENGNAILAIRVRGRVRVRPQIQDTLDKLKLIRLHHARLFEDTPSIRGMINKAKDFITWGEVDEDTILQLLTKRGRLPGNRRLSDAYVKKNSSYKSINVLAKALLAGDADLYDVEGLKPVFRLTPPSGGFSGSKYYQIGKGGITGYRGPEINELAKRMI